MDVLRHTKQLVPLSSIPEFGAVRSIVMRNIFFGDKLPISGLLGWEHKTTLLGSRGSPVQGQLLVRGRLCVWSVRAMCVCVCVCVSV